MKEWRYTSIILKFGTRWSWVVSFMLLLLCPWGYKPQYPLARDWVGPRAGLDCTEREKSIAPVGNQTVVVQPRRYTHSALPATNSLLVYKILHLSACSLLSLHAKITVTYFRNSVVTRPFSKTLQTARCHITEESAEHINIVCTYF